MPQGCSLESCTGRQGRAWHAFLPPIAALLHSLPMALTHQIGNVFVEMFYRILEVRPKELSRFYKEESSSTIAITAAYGRGGIGGSAHVGLTHRAPGGHTLIKGLAGLESLLVSLGLQGLQHRGLARHLLDLGGVDRACTWKEFGGGHRDRATAPRTPR